MFEATAREKVLEQFAVNVFGLMDVTRAVLPHFRANRSGVIVNMSSGAGVFTLPMLSLYCASKFALEGFSEALSYELADLNRPMPSEPQAPLTAAPKIVLALREEPIFRPGERVRMRPARRSATTACRPTCAARPGRSRRWSSPPPSTTGTRSAPQHESLRSRRAMGDP